MNAPDSTSSPRATVETLRWVGGNDGHLVLIDQTRLPRELHYLECRDVETVWEAIRQLRVRGAPAIGIAAAYGVCLGMQRCDGADRAACERRLGEVADYLAGSRPTAVNLFWALDRMRARARGLGDATVGQWQSVLLEEARRIHDEDRAMCHAIGRHGAELLADGAGVLTHCNAGGLATAEYGTALSMFFTAQDQGKRLHVFVDETRPLLQGARLTAWELRERGIPATLICDSMAAQVMREGRVQAVVTGADRIAANGDTANKIGTYGLAVLAEAHGIPFYVAAPRSTFDRQLASGDGIPIELRDPAEITHGFGRETAPPGIDVYNPAFDVTPARLISAIVTDVGLIRPVRRETIAEVLGEETGRGAITRGG
ncbi:MAG: S-methyl-5-thioribose-1-phosphate isomerase [Pirellulaceae bacterium]|nr:S-methyl-5-thioribose-1-phosphate isomerase [Pirellulaceae bacterium]